MKKINLSKYIMRFLRGIEKFSRYYSETKQIISSDNLINEGTTKELVDKLKRYENLLGIKEDKLVDSKSLNIRNTLLKYLDYLDHYILSHFLANIFNYDIDAYNLGYAENSMNLKIDMVGAFYFQKYPDDEEIDPVKYSEVRKLYESIFGRY